MKVVILNAGNGKRLYLITKCVSKGIVPVYDRPALMYHISFFVKMGIQEVALVVSTEHKNSYGTDAVINLVTLIEDIYTYARSIIEVVLDGRPNWALILKIRESNQYIASHIISQLYNKGGIKLITEGDCVPQSKDFWWALACLPLCEEITEVIDTAAILLRLSDEYHAESQLERVRELKGFF